MDHGCASIVRCHVTVAVPALLPSQQPTMPKTTSMSLSLTHPPHSVILSWDPCVFLLLYGQYTHPSVTTHHVICLAQAQPNLALESRAAYERHSFRPCCSPPSRTPFLSSWLWMFLLFHPSLASATLWLSSMSSLRGNPYVQPLRLTLSLNWWRFKNVDC